MTDVIFFGVLLGITCLVFGSPVPNNETDDDEIEKDSWDDWIQIGDILYRKEEVTRAGVTGMKGSRNTYKWPRNVIPYRLHISTPRNQRKRVTQAMRDIERAVPNCYRFMQWSRRNPKTGHHFIRIGNDRRRGGCSSAVGYSRNPNAGPRKITHQRMQIARTCPYGSIVHELIHAIGFFHEQTRDDRDKFVKIMFDNIQPKFKHNFYKNGEEIKEDDVIVHPAYNSTYYDVAYNYDSIMHYSSKGFAIDKTKPTIIPSGASGTLGKGENMGQRNRFSEGDLAMLARRGGCPVPPDKERKLQFEEEPEDEEEDEILEEEEEAEEDDESYVDEDYDYDYENKKPGGGSDQGTEVRLNFNFKNQGKK